MSARPWLTWSVLSLHYHPTNTSIQFDKNIQIIIFLALVALRQPESAWTAFVHFAFSSVVAVMNLYFILDMLSMGMWWWSEAERPQWWYDEWAEKFAWMDMFIAALLLVIGRKISSLG